MTQSEKINLIGNKGQISTREISRLREKIKNFEKKTKNDSKVEPRVLKFEINS